jgi:HEPN domain-containing protein
MAISDLKRIARDFESEDFAAAVFRAQIAAERLCKAIIFLMGLQFKKTHEPTTIIKDLLEEKTLDEEQRKLLSEIISKAKILEDQGTLPRYGLETASNITRPEEIYNRKKALELIHVTYDLVDVFIKFLENRKLLTDMQLELRRSKSELSRLLQD